MDQVAAQASNSIIAVSILNGNNSWIVDDEDEDANARESGTFVPDVLAKVSKLLAAALSTQTSDLCSFQCRIHSKCDELERELHSWSELRYPLGVDEEVVGYEKLLKSSIWLLAAMAYAGGNDELMLPLVKHMVWGFMLDNCVDNPTQMGADAETSKELVAALMGVFRAADHQQHAPASGTASGECIVDVASSNDDDAASTNRGCSRAMRVIMAMGREWWEETQNAGMSSGQQRRLASALHDYLDANIEQVRYRRKDQIPELDAYKSIRLHSVGWPTCSILMEFALGLDLSDPLLQHPLVLALERAVCLHISFVNDLFSFRKELAEADLINLVPILLLRHLHGFRRMNINHHELPLSRAHLDRIAAAVVSEALDIVKDLDRRCVRLVDEINASSCAVLERERSVVDKYLQGISDWLAGNFEWHKRSARYR